MYKLNVKQRRDLRERVTRGVALLDKRHPLWFTKINLNALDLKSGEYCICGQLDDAFQIAHSGESYGGSWSDAFKRLIGREMSHMDKSGAHYGFVAPAALMTTDGYTQEEWVAKWQKWAAEWKFMEDVWRTAVRSHRRAAAKQEKA